MVGFGVIPFIPCVSQTSEDKHELPTVILGPHGILNPHLTEDVAFVPGFPEVAVGKNQWYHFGVGASPTVEPILVGVGMFTGGTGFGF